MVQLKKWQVFIVILFSILGIFFSIPNFFKSTTLSKFPSFLPKEQVVLGLDLQGGSYLLLEVDTESVINENVNSSGKHYIYYVTYSSRCTCTTCITYDT